jgi:hypothetical protein
LTVRSFVQADGTSSAWEHNAGEVISFSGVPSRTFVGLNAEGIAALAALHSLNITNQDRWPSG